MKFGSKELWVGLFFFVGLFLLFVLAMRVDDEGHIFGGKYGAQYHAIMPKTGTIGPGSIVRMAGTGIRVGRVDKVELEDLQDRYEYRVTFSIDAAFKVRKDARVKLAMTTLLQGMHIEITPGSPGAELLEPGSRVTTGVSGDLMETLAGLGDTFKDLGKGGLGKMLLGDEGFANIGKVLDTLASDGGLGKWILGDKAQNDLEPTIADLRKTVENVRKATDSESEGTVARLLHDDKLGGKVDGIITDLGESMKGVRKFAADIAGGKGVIARLASDEKLGGKLDAIVTDIRAVTADLRGGKSALSLLVSDEEMGKQLKSTIASIAKFTEGLASGEGTLAQLINSPDIAVELKRLLSQAREAVEDAREAAPIAAFTSILFGAIQ